MMCHSQGRLRSIFGSNRYSLSTFVPSGMHAMAIGNGIAIYEDRLVMNQLNLIRNKIIKDQRLHDAQLIAETHGKTCFYERSNFDDRRKEARENIRQND